jgi:hypothetical protein
VQEPASLGGPISQPRQPPGLRVARIATASVPIVRRVHYLSTAVQLVGTLVTGYGLLYAYGRATRLPARLREWWDRVRHRRRDATVNVPAMLSTAAMLDADAHRPFTLDEDATPDEKFAETQKYVRELRNMFAPVNFAIDRIDKAIEQARKHADTAAAQALTDARVELQRLRDELNQLQAVDLRIAAAGAFVMALGYALSYFSYFRY